MKAMPQFFFFENATVACSTGRRENALRRLSIARLIGKYGQSLTTHHGQVTASAKAQYVSLENAIMIE